MLLSVSLLMAVALHMASFAKPLLVEVLYSEILNSTEDLVQFFAMLEKTELTLHSLIRTFIEEEEVILDPIQSFTSM